MGNELERRHLPVSSNLIFKNVTYAFLWKVEAIFSAVERAGVAVYAYVNYDIGNKKEMQEKALKTLSCLLKTFSLRNCMALYFTDTH